MIKCYKKENYDDAWADYLVVDSDRIFGFDYFGDFDAWSAQDDINGIKLQIEDGHYQLCSNQEILEQKAAWQLPPTVIAALKMGWK